MTLTLTLDSYLDAVAVAAERLVSAVERAGLGAGVPTCPKWDAGALLAHQAMVHRWARAHIVGTDPEAVPSQTELRQHDDLPGYFREGATAVTRAIREAPVDLVAMTFLADPPPTRLFWARRQTHETTIHAVDALAAVLGRPPLASELDIDLELALDGIDELLCGFYTRGRSKLFDGAEFDVVVAPENSARRWLLHVSERMTVTTAPDSEAAIEITGPAVAIYAGLWNRGTELSVTGDAHLLDRWHRTQRVRWT